MEMSERLKIIVGGNEYHRDLVQKILAADNRFETYDPCPLKNFEYVHWLFGRKYIYWIYGKGPSLWRYSCLWIKKYPILIVHWIGTDVLDALNESDKKSRFLKLDSAIWKRLFLRKQKRGGLINFAGSPWLVNELASLGIIATYLPLTTIGGNKLNSTRSEIIKDVDFLSYVPYNRFHFYGGDKIINLAERWPEYTFLLIHPDLDEVPLDLSQKMPSNMILSSRIDSEKMSEMYRRSKYFIRYTKHDGLSLSVLEALSYKLHVLWTYDFPHTIKIESLDQISNLIPKLVEGWSPNNAGYTYVTENFSVEKWRTDFVNSINDSLSHISHTDIPHVLRQL